MASSTLNQEKMNPVYLTLTDDYVSLPSPIIIHAPRDKQLILRSALQNGEGIPKFPLHYQGIFWGDKEDRDPFIVVGHEEPWEETFTARVIFPRVKEAQTILTLEGMEEVSPTIYGQDRLDDTDTSTKATYQKTFKKSTSDMKYRVAKLNVGLFDGELGMPSGIGDGGIPRVFM